MSKNFVVVPACIGRPRLRQNFVEVSLPTNNLPHENYPVYRNRDMMGGIKEGNDGRERKKESYP